MAHLYTSDKKFLGELLRETLEVPDFQRNFSWDAALVEVFWSDILSFSEQYPGEAIDDKEYFIGPVVLVAQSQQHKKILDGQQRLATATILLSVAGGLLKELGRTDSRTRLQENYIAGFDDYAEAYIYHLTLNQYDRDFYRREVQEPRDVTGYTQPEPMLESHRLIRTARAYFLEQFGKKRTAFGTDTKGFGDWIIRINKVVTDHLSVVHVTSDNEDNAALVFETLNDRGIGLSAPDLLRNLLLSRAQQPQRAGIIDCWREVLQMEGKASVEDFLRHYWLSREGDVKTRSLYREIKSKIIATSMDPLVFSQALQAEADVYEKIVNAEDEDASLKDSLEALVAIGAKSTLPAVLSAYAVGDLAQKRAFLKDFVSLYVRHSSIGGLENNKIEGLAFSIAQQLRASEDFEAARTRIRSFAPTDADFGSRFAIAKVSKTSAARYILRKLEETIRQGTGETLLQTGIVLNLEHIYSKNPTDVRLPNHEDLVDRLGNQTLLLKKINRGLRNAQFADKKPTYAASELNITNQLAAVANWNEAAIIARQRNFATMAPTVWAFE